MTHDDDTIEMTHKDYATFKHLITKYGVQPFLSEMCNHLYEVKNSRKTSNNETAINTVLVFAADKIYDIVKNKD